MVVGSGERALHKPLNTHESASPSSAATVAPVEVTIEGAEEQQYHVSPYPYEIGVVAKTSKN
jgi:hypothetical protein